MLQTFDERNRDLIVNVNGRLLHEPAGEILRWCTASLAR